MVWFSEAAQPRLGQVLEVDPSVPTPVVVQYFVPVAGARSIADARFVAKFDPEDRSPVVTRVTVHQVRLSMQGLSLRGFLLPADRRKLKKLLEG